MRLKNKLILGASALSLVPLTALSCSNERSAEENKKIMNAVASTVQVSVFDKDSQYGRERIKTNISDVYSTYVSKIEDVRFYAYDTKKYEVVNVSFLNLNTKTEVKFQLKDIKTGTLSDVQTYVIRGFKPNPEYTTSLTAKQVDSVELYKRELEYQANVNAQATVDAFKGLEQYLSEADFDYSSEQFNKDLESLKSYLTFIFNRYKDENYTTNFEITSLGEYLEHQVDQFLDKFTQYKPAYDRLLSLKAAHYLRKPEDNQKFTQEEISAYTKEFKDRAEKAQNSVYWFINDELRQKYQTKLSNILDELSILEDKKDETKLQVILGQFRNLDLTPKDKVNYAILRLLNNVDGGYKVLNDLEAEIKALQAIDEAKPATEEQRAIAERYKELIKYTQYDIERFTRDKDGKIGETSEYKDNWANPVTPEVALQSEVDFWNNQKEALKLPENSWYSPKQFDNDVKTVEEFYRFLQRQNVTDFDDPQTAHWDFEVNNYYQYIKYNVDVFEENYPEYEASIKRLNTLLANKEIKENPNNFSDEKAKEVADKANTKFAELIQKPEFRAILLDEYRDVFGGENINKYGTIDGKPVLWDNASEAEKFKALIESLKDNKDNFKVIWASELVWLNISKTGFVKSRLDAINSLLQDPKNEENKDKDIENQWQDIYAKAEYLKDDVKKDSENYIHNFLVREYSIQVQRWLDKLEKDYQTINGRDVTEQQAADAVDMQKWLYFAKNQLIETNLPNENSGDTIISKTASELEAEALKVEEANWKALNKESDPIYVEFPELFESDLDKWIKFLSFLQSQKELSEEEKKELESKKDAKSNEKLRFSSFIESAVTWSYAFNDIQNEGDYYRSNIDLFMSRLYEQGTIEAYGRLRGLEAYNWIKSPQSQDNPKLNEELITPEALEQLYKDLANEAQKLFFVDMTNENAEESSLKPKNGVAAQLYDDLFEVIKGYFKYYSVIKEQKDTDEEKAALLHDYNYTFKNDEENLSLRDRYLEYLFLSQLRNELYKLSDSYEDTPVNDEHRTQIEELKNYLNDFDVNKKQENIDFIKNKVLTLLSRNEGEKAKYSQELFLGSEYNAEDGENAKIGGDLANIINFWDFLSQHSAIKDLQKQDLWKLNGASLNDDGTSLSIDGEEVNDYSLSQYANNRVGDYQDLEKKYRESMTRVASYIAESFLENDNIDPRYSEQISAIKTEIEKFIKEYEDFKKDSDKQENLKLEQFKDEIAELDALTEELKLIKEEGANFDSQKRKYYMALPDNSIPTDNFLRVEALSNYILKLKAFIAHYNFYVGDKLTQAHKEDVEKKLKELKDNLYLVSDLEKVQNDLLQVNSQFIHPAHDAQPNTDKTLAHDYTLEERSEKDSLTRDVKLIINFYSKAQILKALLDTVISRDSERSYTKAIQYYTQTFDIAKQEYEKALTRIYTNKKDYFMQLAYKFSNYVLDTKFYQQYIENDQNLKAQINSAKTWYNDTLKLFGLNSKNEDDSAITEADKQKVVEHIFEQAKSLTKLSNSDESAKAAVDKMNFTTALNYAIIQFRDTSKPFLDKVDQVDKENTESSNQTDNKEEAQPQE
ncbi:hypothetical protein [Mycoplasmopsis sturni]|uniref:hypothetical protein n=1 Tax=Mycoplasmopsis sturni TaxID=39047 RepID=UPI00055C5DEC|nr:hypothetical protein [Mycoplasmopsis sturni]